MVTFSDEMSDAGIFIGWAGLKTIVDSPNPQSAVLEGLKAAMPARWCSLVVEAGRRPVRIQSLVGF